MGRIVAFLNKKGGVGKTSTVHHLGGTLAKMGRRVLVVDADPQSSLTKGILGPNEAEALDPRTTIAAVFDESGVINPASLVRPTAFANLSILPGSESAEDFNVPKPWETGADQYVLRDALGEVADSFDLVLIDCPPHIQLWAWAALVAAQGVVVPLQPEDYGAQGMASIRKTLNRVQASVNPQLQVIGYLVTMFNRSLAVHESYRAYLAETYGPDAFTALVPLAKDFKESVSVRKPVVDFKPKSAASKAIAALADEFLARIDERIPLAERRVA